MCSPVFKTENRLVFIHQIKKVSFVVQFEYRPQSSQRADIMKILFI
jgi:hypothetical protein